MTPCAAKWMACCEEPHWRSMVVAGTDSGQPAAGTALRPMLRDFSETCMTQPMITSSIRAGSSWLRSATARRASEARSTACQLRSFPLRLPPGVRTASTITAVVMVSPPNPAAAIGATPVQIEEHSTRHRLAADPGPALVTPDVSDCADCADVSDWADWAEVWPVGSAPN